MTDLALIAASGVAGIAVGAAVLLIGNVLYMRQRFGKGWWKS